MQLGNVIYVIFRGLGNESHSADSLYRVLSCSSLTAEHNGGRAVVNGVGNIGYLRSGGSYIGYHGLKHLCGGYDLLAGIVALADNAFLNGRYLLKGYLNAHVPSGDHYAVSGLQYLVNVFHPVHVLDLCDYPGTAPAEAFDEFFKIRHICRSAYKGSCNKIKAHSCAELQIVHVTLGKIGHGQLHSRHVDPLVIAYLAPVYDLGLYLIVFYLGDPQLHCPVVYENGSPCLHIAGQPLEGNAGDLFVTYTFLGGKGKFVPVL